MSKRCSTFVLALQISMRVPLLGATRYETRFQTRPKSYDVMVMRVRSYRYRTNNGCRIVPMTRNPCTRYIYIRTAVVKNVSRCIIGELSRRANGFNFLSFLNPLFLYLSIYLSPEMTHFLIPLSVYRSVDKSRYRTFYKNISQLFAFSQRYPFSENGSSEIYNFEDTRKQFSRINK